MIEYYYNKAKRDLLLFKIDLKIRNPNEWSVRNISLNELKKDLEELNENTKWNN